jgi:hypothetical protein
VGFPHRWDFHSFYQLAPCLNGEADEKPRGFLGAAIFIGDTPESTAYRMATLRVNNLDPNHWLEYLQDPLQDPLIGGKFTMFSKISHQSNDDVFLVQGNYCQLSSGSP